MALGMPNLPGANPAEAVARKLKRDLADKAAARAFEQHCASKGITGIDKKYGFCLRIFPDSPHRVY